MQKLDNIKAQILGIGVVIENAIETSFRENDSVIEDLNIVQLQKGDGETLPDYSPTSVEVYGKPAGPIKLFDEGDFYRGINLQAGASEAELTGKDSKTAELQFEFGEEIIGLSEESLEQFKNEYISPEIFEALKRAFS